MHIWNCLKARMASAHGYGSMSNCAPKAGQVEDGYRFKGGKADDPKNWVKVK